MIDLLVTGGHVVTPHEEAVLDVGVARETIAFVARPGSIDVEVGRTIDATGKLVLPGGVEPHAHIHEPMHRGWTHGEEVWLQSPEGATRAALFGGTTTVVSFAFMDVHVKAREFDASVAVEHRTRIFDERSHADFAFHPVLTGTPSEATLATIADAVADGTATFKFFTTDLTTAQTGIRLDYARLAEEAGAALYVAHVCGRPALEAITERRAAGQPVYGEVLHNCMCFSLDDYERPDGAKYHIGMGLRPREDGEALWQGLADGRLSTLATDEYTTSLAVKLAGTNIETTPGGHVGIETRGLIGYSEGVGKRGLSLRRFVEVFSTSPARVTGLYPRKGAIAPGSDADLVIWDPDAEWTISMADLHHDGDYSPWEGWAVRGRPAMTILRGRVVVEDGRMLGAPGDGRFVKRKLDPDVLSRPAF